MVLAQAPPVEVTPAAHGYGVLTPLPQKISGITASHSVNTMSMNMKKEPLK